MKPHYEPDAEICGVYKLCNDGVAWRILGWETQPDEDTEWTGIEERTGRVVARMVGDDSLFVYELEDFEPLVREEYCGECGQIGCMHDGLDREAS